MTKTPIPATTPYTLAPDVQAALDAMTPAERLAWDAWLRAGLARLSKAKPRELVKRLPVDRPDVRGLGHRDDDDEVGHAPAA